MKKKGFKVKRTRRNLYKKRKTAGQKVVETVLLVVIVAVLVFVGYSVAPPIINYFSALGDTENNSSEPVWTPPVTSAVEDNSSDDGANSSTESSTTTTEEQKPPAPALLSGSVIAPDTALQSEKALKEYLEKAVKDGYGTVIFTVKNTDGTLLYKSDIKELQNVDNVSGGKISAKQIVKLCKDAGVTAVADINTLYDRYSGYAFEDTYYSTTDNFTWLDAAPGKGGKPWSNPYSATMVKYLSDITGELTKAGFETVILSNTMFPHFGSYDYAIISADYKSATRSDKLAELANSCLESADEKKTVIRIDAADFVTRATSEYKATAEIYGAKDKLKECNLLITFDIGDLGAALKTDDKNTLTLDKDAAKAVTQIFTEVDKQLKKDGITEYSIGIVNSSKLKEAKLKEVKEALEKLGSGAVVIG